MYNLIFIHTAMVHFIFEMSDIGSWFRVKFGFDDKIGICCLLTPFFKNSTTCIVGISVEFT